MAQKRRRVSDSGEGEPQTAPAQQQDNSFAAQARKPHGEVWYADGNIILATGNHLFRVHKSILAKHSTVFADMFKFDLEGVSEAEGPQAQVDGGAMDAVSDRWEGIPTVQLAGDTDEDVTTVLRSLYEHNFYVVGKPIPVWTIFSLLRMGTKYDFRSIRTDMISHLSAIFPSTYGGYKQCAAQNHGFTDEQFFTLLSLVRRDDASILQPFLFYVCADRSYSQILELSRPLEKEDLVRLLNGREMIQKRAYQMFFAALQYDAMDPAKIGKRQKICDDDECLSRFRSQLEKLIRFDNYDIPVFPLGSTRLGVLEGVPKYPMGDIHKDCGSRYLRRLDTIQKCLWEDLPAIFDLGNWDQVKGVIIVADE
ncbi:hypothetical protein SCHPADRAFT_932840 [Schizopora paradoxa]|uniref:BTB domain-containing protein n=1 Tax=Schizopora paradoxa TaxID=27342 RepID=A0A0H2RBC5_9AGAM|nr:hypothetical protein SCHPADRAFT_932840 [Schizopora paradoxa]